MDFIPLNLDLSQARVEKDEPLVPYILFQRNRPWSSGAMASFPWWQRRPKFLRRC